MSGAVRRYYRGAELVAMKDVAAGENRYYHFDHQGTTQALTSSVGTVTDRFNSDAWGRILGSSASIINQMWFVGSTGYYTSLDLLYVRKRWYSPRQALWISKDQLSFEPTFQYARNNPASRTDPSGLKPTWDRKSTRLNSSHSR